MQVKVPVKLVETVILRSEAAKNLIVSLSTEKLTYRKDPSLRSG